jgi:hypothetical protein
MAEITVTIEDDDGNVVTYTVDDVPDQSILFAAPWVDYLVNAADEAFLERFG